MSPEGIEINCRPYAGSGGPLTLSRFRTEVRFPAGFSDEQKGAVLEAITHCAVKEIVATGPTVEFAVTEVQ